jgi:hypothetical protein
MDLVCSHCDRTAAVSEAKNEKTSAGISADGVYGLIQPLTRTARLRPTNEMEDICLAGQSANFSICSSETGRQSIDDVEDLPTWPTKG